LATWDGTFVLEFGKSSETARNREEKRGREQGIMKFTQAGFMFSGLSLYFHKHLPHAKHLLGERLFPN
jgi:hypothetical protein